MCSLPSPWRVVFQDFKGVIMDIIGRVVNIIDERIKAGNRKPDEVILPIEEYEELMGEIAELDPVICDKLSFSALRCCGVGILCGDESGN